MDGEKDSKGEIRGEKVKDVVRSQGRPEGRLSG